MAIAFLATIAAQMGAAWFNSNRNKAHSKKMAELQRAYEEKVTLSGIENARNEFAELCAFQREIEKQSQLDRLTLIRDNHEQILLQDAYENALNKWPLLVPPYVIANAPLTIGTTECMIIPLNCILTTSSDLGFNNNVFHKLEEQIAVFCSRYWNVSANKSIRFFQEAWRDDAKDLGSRHKDIYAHLKNVPTLLISPILKNETVVFRFYWWGLSLDPTDAHIDELNELNPELTIPITAKMKYNDEIINLIISECVPKLEAFISYFADLYYFNFYTVAPSLPLLLSLHQIKLKAEDIKAYNTTYSDCFDKFLQAPSQIDNLNDLVLGFAPCIEDKKNLRYNLINYIKSLPEAKQSESISALRTLSDLSSDISEKAVITQFVNGIEILYSQQSAQPINWSVRQYDTLNILDVLSICLKALPLMPSCDTYHLLKRDDMLAIIAFFSSNGNVASWGKNGIWVFQTKEFYCPSELFGSDDRFSCKTESLTLVEQIIKRNMKNEDVSAILDGQFEKLKKELLPVASKIDDLFKKYIDRVKAQIAQESGFKDVDTIYRHQVKYEDVVAWLRKAKEAMGSQKFDGAFLVKDRGGFFDKYPYKIYICLTLNKTPLTEMSHPKCIISFESTDDTLDEMFGKNQNVQINFK